MAEAAVFLTDGFEEIEGLAVLDILRRAQVEVVSVSVTGKIHVVGAHDITVKADCLYDEFMSFYHGRMMLVLPGGPGTASYKSHEGLLALLSDHHKSNGNIAAICAAPTVLGELGILDGKTAVCHHTVEAKLRCGRLGVNDVERDGNILTSKAAGTAVSFGLAVLTMIKGKAITETVAKGIGVLLSAD